MIVTNNRNKFHMTLSGLFADFEFQLRNALLPVSRSNYTVYWITFSVILPKELENLASLAT